MAGTSLGTAYVQIVPSAQGIKGSITNVLSGEADAAGSATGTSLGSKVVSFAKKAIIAGAIGKVIKSSLDEGAKLQQSYFGGLDTLYGAAADAARAYAREASAAGISMNDYAEQAVSFGAALKNAFGGDVAKAAEAANTAIMDMADNSAKMGTDISSVQMAYQGFAKQNYTMLDNLKLGYGGTKTEMERLLADAEKLTGIEYNIDNLGDVYEAIHVIQGELGLTGVAAAEASTTFSGSFNAMKASAQNLLGSLAVGENVGPAMTQLATSVSTFFFSNFLPMIGTLVQSLPPAILAFLQTGLPLLIDGVSSMLSSLGMWISGVANNLTSAKVKTWLATTLPQIIVAGGQLIGKLAEAFITNLPKIVTAIARIGGEIIKGLGSALWGRVRAAAQGVVAKFMEPINSLIGLIQGVIDKIKSKFPINLGNIFNFKVPHINVGSKTVTVGDKEVKVPTFSVSWYAQGGIFNNPSLIGVGEAGAEAVVPLDRFWEEIGNSNARTDALLAEQNQLLMAVLEEVSKEKNFKVDGIWAGRYVNSLVR